MSDFFLATPVGNLGRIVDQFFVQPTCPQISSPLKRNLFEDSPNFSQLIGFVRSTNPFTFDHSDIVKLEYEDDPLIKVEANTQRVVKRIDQVFDIERQKRMIEEQSKYPKNIIKNFIVEFQNYLLRLDVKLSQSDQTIFYDKPDLKFQIDKVLKYFGTHRKVANSKQLMEALSYPKTREMFIQFLEHEAPNWIRRSNKLQLKELHELAIPYLIQAAKERRRIRFPIKEWRAKVSY